MPSPANSTGGSPYSFSKAHLPPLVSANHHSASRTLTTNQPSLTGVSPDPRSASCARGTNGSGVVTGSGERLFESEPVRGLSVRRQHELDGFVKQWPQPGRDLLDRDAFRQPLRRDL